MTKNFHGQIFYENRNKPNKCKSKDQIYEKISQNEK